MGVASPGRGLHAGIQGRYCQWKVKATYGNRKMAQFRNVLEILYYMYSVVAFSCLVLLNSKLMLNGLRNCKCQKTTLVSKCVCAIKVFVYTIKLC